MKKNSKYPLGVFGPYPPPVGGVSVHIQRLAYHLEKEKIPYLIYNHDFSESRYVIPTNKRIWWYLKFLFQKKHQLVHFHRLFDFHYVYLFLFSYINRTPLIITIHSANLSLYKLWKRKIIFWLLKHTKNKTLISVSDKLNILLNKNDIKSHYIPAYIPPVNIEKISLPKIEKTRFLFSIWKVNKELSEDVYDMPMAFEFLKQHKEKYHMTFMIGNREFTDEKYLQDMIDQYGIRDNMDIIYDKPLVNYFSNFSFLLRPNLKDGFPLSIREALDMNLPVVASDAGSRAKGTIMFKSGDIAGMIEKIEYVVATDKEIILQHKENTNYHQQIINFYKEVITWNSTKSSNL